MNKPYRGIRIAVSCIFLTVAAGLWTSVASAQADATAPANPALSNETCLGCHGQEGGILSAHTAVPGGPPTLQTDRFLGSVHGKFQCVECHTNIAEFRTTRLW